MKFAKSYIFFWLTATVIFFISLFYNNSDANIAFNIHDTYYVVASFYFSIIISILLYFIGLIYYIHSKFKIPLIKLLTIIHTVVTISCVLIYYSNSALQFQNQNNFPLVDNSYNYSSFLIIGFFIQPIFLFNSLFGTFKKIRKPKL